MGIQGNFEGENIKNSPFGDEIVPSNIYETGRRGTLEGTERRKFHKNRKPGGSSDLDSPRRSGIQSAEPMGIVEGSGQGIPGVFSPAQKLDQQLESAGAYDRFQFEPRRRRMLKTYLTTEKPILEIAQEEGLSKTQAHTLLHASMDVAFFALPEDQRAEYDNNPEIAFQTRSKQQTEEKSERLKAAHSQRPKNPDTGKIEFSKTHRRNLTEGNLRRWENAREIWRALQAKDQPSEQHDPQDGNTPT